MKSQPQGIQANWLRAVNIAGVVVIALLVCVELSGGIIYLFDRSSVGDFGINLDTMDRLRVVQVTPGSPADEAGVRVGDHINLPSGSRYHDMFLGPGPHPGEKATIAVERGTQYRGLTLVARPPVLSTADIISIALTELVGLTIFVLGASLALVRPSVMTWSFYCFGFSWDYLAPQPQYIPPQWYVAYTLLFGATLVTVGIVAFLLFFLLFPSNRAVGWRNAVYRLVPFFLAVLLAGQWWQIRGDLLQIISAESDRLWQHIWDASIAIIGAVSLTSLLGLFRGSSGLERQRIKWVVFGTACAFVCVLIVALSQEGLLPDALWVNVAPSVVIALPLTMGYAVMKYRVIDVRFVVSRTLVYGVIALIIGILVAFLDWIFSTKFSNSRSQTAVYAGAALLIGLSLNTARLRIGKIFDSLFFRKWHRSQQLANAVDHTLIRAASNRELHEPLTAGVATAFSLASVALFERVTDGGYVRVAAVGWQSGSLWHLLPDDALARNASDASRPFEVHPLEWDKHAAPGGLARPTLAIPINAGRTATAILLLGVHQDGTVLDPDELRAIQRLAADAATVYGSQRTDMTVFSAPPQRLASI